MLLRKQQKTYNYSRSVNGHIAYILHYSNGTRAYIKRYRMDRRQHDLQLAILNLFFAVQETTEPLLLDQLREVLPVASLTPNEVRKILMDLIQGNIIREIKVDNNIIYKVEIEYLKLHKDFLEQVNGR